LRVSEHFRAHASAGAAALRVAAAALRVAAAARQCLLRETLCRVSGVSQRSTQNSLPRPPTAPHDKENPLSCYSSAFPERLRVSSLSAGSVHGFHSAIRRAFANHRSMLRAPVLPDPPYLLSLGVRQRAFPILHAPHR